VSFAYKAVCHHGTARILLFTARTRIFCKQALIICPKLVCSAFLLVGAGGWFVHRPSATLLILLLDVVARNFVCGKTHIRIYLLEASKDNV
jgi:hypothetical protein